MVLEASLLETCRPEVTDGGKPLAPVLAGNAQCHRRIDIQPFWQDILTARKAISIVILIKAAQCRVEYRQPVSAPFLARQIHRLLLHRIHARQAANRLLVKFDRCPPLLVAITQGVQLVNLGQNLLAESIAVHC